MPVRPRRPLPNPNPILNQVARLARPVPRGIVARVGAVVPRIFVNRVAPFAVRVNPYVGAVVTIAAGIKAIYDGANWVISSVNQAQGAVQDARRMYDQVSTLASDTYGYLTGPREAGIIDPPFTPDESGPSRRIAYMEDPPFLDGNVTSSSPQLGVPPSVSTQVDSGVAKMIYDPTAFRKVRRFRKRLRSSRFLFRR